MDPTKQPFSTYEPPSDAPPPYTSPQVWGSTPPPISDKAPHASNNLTYSPTATTYPSQSPPSQPRLLHIYRTSLLSCNLTILAPDKTTTAYTIHANSGSLISSKPHMKIYRGAVPHRTNPIDPPIGTATFHTITRSIDLTLHDGRPASLSPHGIFRPSYEFPSAIGVLRWKLSGLGSNMVCETVAGGEWVAKFEAASFAVEKRGKFEIVSWEVGEEGVDEIVVSGLAVMEQVRRQRGAAAT